MKNILMLDDDLTPRANGISIGRTQLQPWLTWMKKIKSGDVHLIEAQNLAKFVQELKLRENEPEEGPKYIHGIIIDIHWELTTQNDKTFACIGFPEISISSTEAGEQLLRLIFDHERRQQLIPAVAVHTNRQFAVLTNIRGVEMNLTQLTDRVRILNKIKQTISQPGTTKSIELPSQDFQDWVNNLK